MLPWFVVILVILDIYIYALFTDNSERLYEKSNVNCAFNSLFV